MTIMAILTFENYLQQQFDESFLDSMKQGYQQSYQQSLQPSNNQNFEKFSQTALPAIKKAGTIAQSFSKKTGVPLPLATALIASGITGGPAAVPFAALLYFVKKPLMKGASAGFDAGVSGVKNIQKSFDGTEVLKNISNRFEQGKTNLIIGRSGSGKTVLLKSILGLYDIDQGEIWYDDRDIVKMHRKERKKLRREIGMVFQGGALFDSLSVEANIRFPLDMFTHQSPAEKKKRVEFCLEHVNIEKKCV